jgi:hypothetical protein
MSDSAGASVALLLYSTCTTYAFHLSRAHRFSVDGPQDCSLQPPERFAHPIDICSVPYTPPDVDLSILTLALAAKNANSEAREGVRHRRENERFDLHCRWMSEVGKLGCPLHFSRGLPL